MSERDGPLRTREGTIISYTLLGSVADYVHMDSIYGNQRVSDSSRSPPARLSVPKSAEMAPKKVVMSAKDHISRATSMTHSPEESEKRAADDNHGREERTLADWQRHNNSNIAQSLSKRAGKDSSRLPMGEYRQRAPQVVGHDATEGNFEERPSVVRFREDSIASAVKPDSFPSEPSTSAPHLSLAAQRLFYEARPGEVAPSVLTVYNQGTYAVSFKWECIGGLSNLDVKACKDGNQRFYLSHRKGIIPPGAAFDFRACFKSDIPGMFSERWKMVTDPAMEEWTDRIVLLQGAAIEEDKYKSKREEVDRILERRVALSLASEALELVLNRAWDVVAAHRNARHARGVPSATEQAFRRQNGALHLRYDDVIVSKMDAMASEALIILSRSNYTWDKNVMNLHHLIESVPDADARSRMLQELNRLVDELQSTTNTDSSFVLHTIGTDILSQVAECIPAISAKVRKSMGLPLGRSATAKFSIPDAEDVDIQSVPPADPHKKPQQPPAAAAQPLNAAAKGGKPAAPAPASLPSAAAKAPIPSGRLTAPSTAATKDPMPPPGAPSNATGGRGATSDNSKGSISNLNSAGTARAPPRSPRSWTRERADLEWRYRGELKKEVSALLDTAIARLDGLWGDATEGRHNW
ncbi:hypothetical protein SeMB42_g01884 [Synchytrium endobioticum]|uniref:Uncharacterized protein n=1 Tax=Synchytrium endobioticum TaxID=286115 RepID=A0A507DIU9_9FUNG|nr:hypothetical protein SeLEV6574_g05985 [Synchytrium endobioticum]TPX51523.1 hypothetical protein SeMB42_g01884 [Synchytrium endobioticum]